MSVTVLKVFDHALEKASVWLDDVMKAMNWYDRHKAYSALRAVLHALRDRLPLTEAVNLGSQLPMLVRGIYYDGWNSVDKPLQYRHKDEFLAHVEEQLLGVEYSNLEKVTSAVLDVLSNHISGAEINYVIKQLPAEIQELWR